MLGGFPLPEDARQQRNSALADSGKKHPSAADTIFCAFEKNPSDFVPVFGGAFARTTREHLGVNWGLLW